MNISIIRHRRSEYSICGTLYVDGVRVCDTIENRGRHLAEGRYTVVMRRCGCTGKNIPIVISSGYRCPELNAAVGGVANSQHQTGEAADIAVPSSAEGYRWMEWIADNCIFDQLIWETADDRHFWLHVSCRQAPGASRLRVVSYLRKRQ